MSCLITHTMLYSIIATASRVHIPGFVILTVTMLMAGSSCLGHGHHAFGMVTMPLAGSPCLRQGHRAFGRVTVALAGSPWLWQGHHAFGRITVP